MKRDWDVIREVLLKVEESSGDKEISSEEFPEPKRALVAYNMLLLKEAGLVDGGGRDSSMGPPFAFVNRMKWEGHELLDTIRNDTAWKRIKATEGEERGSDRRRHQGHWKGGTRKLAPRRLSPCI